MIDYIAGEGFKTGHEVEQAIAQHVYEKGKSKKLFGQYASTPDHPSQTPPDQAVEMNISFFNNGKGRQIRGDKMPDGVHITTFPGMDQTRHIRLVPPSHIANPDDSNGYIVREPEQK